MADYFNFSDPLLMALLQAMAPRASQPIPQSIQQGAQQYANLVPQFDPTFGLNNSAAYQNSSPLEQSLSRAANLRQLDTQVGLRTNPEEVLAGAQRNDQPDIAMLAKLAIERQAAQQQAQNQQVLEQIKSEGDIQKAAIPAQADIEKANIYTQKDKYIATLNADIQKGKDTNTAINDISRNYASLLKPDSMGQSHPDVANQYLQQALQLINQGVGSPTQNPDKILQQNVDDELQKAGFATDPGGAIQKVREMVAAEAGKNPAMAQKINAYLDSKMPKTTASTTQSATKTPPAGRVPSPKSFSNDFAQLQEGLKKLQGVAGGGGTSTAADVAYGQIAPLVKAGRLQDAAVVYERLKPYLSTNELAGLKFTPEFKLLFQSGLVK